MWRSVNITGFEHYIISTKGEVINTRSLKRLAGWYNKEGYHRVKLNDKGYGRKFYTHRLVALTFLDNPKKLPEVHHINNRRSDNDSDNLKWVTHQENMMYVYDRRNKIYNKVEVPASDYIEREEKPVLHESNCDLPF